MHLAYIVKKCYIELVFFCLEGKGVKDTFACVNQGKEMIKNETLSAFRSDLKKYLKPFLSAQYKDDIYVLRNIIHAEKVVENIGILADSLEVSQSEKNTAEAVALFHDIGRFWILLQDPAEKEKYDHAQASIEYLKSNNTFNSLDEQVKTNLTEVILNHHLPQLSQMEDSPTRFYLRLLRDADKLDIWRMTTDNLANSHKRQLLTKELGLKDKPVVTATYCMTILEGGFADKKGIVTFSDYLLYHMSWAFDLNFRKSFQVLNQKQYMRQYYDALPKNDLVFEIYRRIKIHIENQIL